MGKGAMTGVTYIQRVNTKGGVAPADPCAAASAGHEEAGRLPGGLPVLQDVVWYARGLIASCVNAT